MLILVCHDSSQFNFRLMKVQRAMNLATKSLEHFYTRVFKFDNYNFVDLTKSIPAHERDEFSVAEKVSANEELYIASFKLSRTLLFNDTPKSVEIARKRFPYIYVFVRTFHMIVFLTTLKIFYEIVLRLF